LSTCQQIRTKASLLFFSLNSFDFGHLSDLTFFVYRVTAQEKYDAIKRVRLGSFQVQRIAESDKTFLIALHALRQLDGSESLLWDLGRAMINKLGAYKIVKSRRIVTAAAF
jgi:hypothetical protein